MDKAGNDGLPVARLIRSHECTICGCPIVFLFPEPLRSGTYALTIYYHVFLWPISVHTTEKRFKAALNAEGKTEWLAIS